jgi:predicted naringenin-chalcone synthase
MGHDRTRAAVANAYINRIATVVPPHDVHAAFVRYAQSQLDDGRERRLFRRMVERGGIEHRYSYLAPAEATPGQIDAAGFFVRGSFPGTAQRMRFFEAHAPDLAAEAVQALDLNGERARVTHLLVTCCTGMFSPGLDFQLIDRCGLPNNIERTVIGFMGCNAAINALQLARHIVRSEAAARVVVVNLEMCTIHLQEVTRLEAMLSFLLWGDGCAASLVTADPEGLLLDSFTSLVATEKGKLVTWNVRESGFDMILSGQLPNAIFDILAEGNGKVLGGVPADEIGAWAVHPGGRSILDSVERALALKPEALASSREVLRCFGNMSSATVMFVLQMILAGLDANVPGCAMAFGPGLVAETMLFHRVG